MIYVCLYVCECALLKRWVYVLCCVSCFSVFLLINFNGAKKQFQIHLILLQIVHYLSHFPIKWKMISLSQASTLNLCVCKLFSTCLSDSYWRLGMRELWCWLPIKPLVVVYHYWPFLDRTPIIVCMCVCVCVCVLRLFIFGNPCFTSCFNHDSQIRLSFRRITMTSD